MAPDFSVIPVKYVVPYFLIAFSLFAVSDCKSVCHDRSDCGSTQLCCNNECVYGSSCLGHGCTLDSDCSSGESCCSKKCISGPTCVGYSCSSESDCDGTGTYHDNKVVCCKGTCTKQDDCYSDPTAMIVGPIVGFLFICLVWSICYVCRRRTTAHRETEVRVIAEQRVTATTTTTTTRCATQTTSPLYQGQVPPSYQQGYPYYPLTAIPPPHCNPGAMAATHQPPPDTVASQERSGGGVYAPKPSYGAVPCT